MNFSEWQSIAGMAAGVLYVVAFVPYVLAILQGKAKPSRITWLIASMLNGIAVFSSVSLGAQNTLWMMSASMIGSFSVFLLSLRYGQGGGSRLDKFLILAAGAVAIVWASSGLPLIAQLSISVLVLFAAIPTIRIAYKTPELESRLTWFFFTLSCIVNFLSIERWTLGIITNPIVSFTVDVTVLALLLRRTARTSS